MTTLTTDLIQQQIHKSTLHLRFTDSDRCIMNNPGLSILLKHTHTDYRNQRIKSLTFQIVDKHALPPEPQLPCKASGCSK